MKKIHIEVLAMIVSDKQRVVVQGKGLGIRGSLVFYFIYSIIFKHFSANANCFYKSETTKIPPQNTKPNNLFGISLQHSLKLAHEGRACYQCCSMSFQFKIKN